MCFTLTIYFIHDSLGFLPEDNIKIVEQKRILEILILKHDGLQANEAKNSMHFTEL